MLHSRMLRALAAAVLILSTIGCFGRFEMSAAARRFNLDIVKDQWGREIVFVVMHVIPPVYPICAFGDLFVVNSIEFWSGENPLSEEEAITLVKEEGAEDPTDSVAAAAPEAQLGEIPAPSFKGADD